MALAERRSMGSKSQDRRTGESGNHTQVTSFGVCAAGEEPLLEHILIRAICKCANGHLFCDVVSTHAEQVQKEGETDGYLVGLCRWTTSLETDHHMM